MAESPVTGNIPKMVKKPMYIINIHGLKILTPCNAQVQGEYNFTMFFDNYIVSFIATYDSNSWPEVEVALEKLRNTILSNIEGFKRYDVDNVDKFIYLYDTHLTYTWKDGEEIEHTEIISISIKKP